MTRIIGWAVLGLVVRYVIYYDFFTSLSRDYMHFKKKEAGNAEEFIIIQIVYSWFYNIYI